MPTGFANGLISEIMGMIIGIVKMIFFKIACVVLFGENKNKFLRLYGIKIGKRSEIYTTNFSTEPYLIEIGDHVVVSSGTKFVTHDGAGWVMEDKYPNLDLFGQIKIGNNTFIGIDTIILANSTIGSNCLIGAGSVIRGIIPDNSVAMGNPAKVVMKTKMYETLYLNHTNCLKTKYLKSQLKTKAIKEHFKHLNK
jgi:acetyltransferase-like isoleucine patch superfamily enzyme